MFEKFLSIVIAICFIAVNMLPVSVFALEAEDVITPVYYMDFSPDSDGKFYDSPAGTQGRAEVARIDNPSGLVQLPNDAGNLDNKIINIQPDNSTKIYSSQANKDLYASFSKGAVQGEFNTGASGAANDYCLKTVDTSGSNSYTAVVTLELPKVYGSTADSTQKYRIETDWKWQSYNSTPAATAAGNPSGASILGFIIGGKTMYLKTQATRGDEYRGTGAFYFYDGDNDSKSTFGLTPSSQATKEADLAKITKSASAFDATQSGKWIHITVDIDFASGTIYGTLQGDGVKREISTAISKGQDTFKSGISAIKVYGSTKGERRINFFDNIKLSTVVSQLTDEQILENAASESYTFNDIKGGNTSSSNVTENLQLPTGKDGVSVTWSVSPSAASKYINLATGVITRPTHVEGNQTISLTPTYSLNGLTRQGASIDGIVLKALDPADYPLDSVYYMDFSPRSDGNFYDYPENISGGKVIKRLAVSSDAGIFPNHTIADNMCIALDSEDNISKIQPGVRTLNDYVVFSKGSANGDVNTGASGNKDDYCIKMIDASTDSNPSVKITLPKAYGNPETSGDYVKYRFEMDYKWQQYSSMTSTSLDRPSGTNWLRFYFGNNYINLYSKSGSEHTAVPDGNGESALCFTSTAFGMGATTNQVVPAGQEGKITAPMFGSSASGSWVHITVDFDFEEGTIRAVLKCEGNEDRIIETSIPEGTGAGGASFKELFMEGLTGISIQGATGGNRRVIWADNIKISPMKTIKKTPSEKLYDANNPATAFNDIKGANSDASSVTENLGLIFKKGDADVTWEVTPATGSKYINVSSGLVTRPSFVKGDQSVTLTPTYTVAGRKLTGDSIDITISALGESALEKIERLITTSPFTFADINGANTSANSVLYDLALPSSAESDVLVTWSVLSSDMAEFVDVLTGKITRPKYTQTDKKVTLIPTYKLDEIEMTGEPVEITIVKNTLDLSGYDVKDAYAITESDLVGRSQSFGNVTGSLNLPKSGKLHGSTISWSANSYIIDTNTGAIKRPFGSSSANVVLTATVTNGTNTTVRSFTITVVDSNYGSGNSYSGSSFSGGSVGSTGGGVSYVGSSVVSGSSTPSVIPGKNDVFSDIASVSWAKEYITKLYDAGVINGDGNGLFYPERNVTREEFVKMLLLSFGIKSDGAPQMDFSDVKKDSWFADYVSVAYNLGIVNGVTATEFGAGRSITRQDMAVMIARCLNYKGIVLESNDNSSVFGDESNISGYALDAVKKLKDAGVLNGDSNGNFNPLLFATRAEVAKVLGILMP